MTTDVTVTDEAVASLEGTADPRLKELLTGLIRHLHAFARETRLTQTEWERAIGFLTETGQTCTDTRQEFILLSDVLGLSMLVETVNGDHAAGSTESTVLGPFHMTESPVRRLGANIDLVGGGEPCVVSGRIVSDDGTPLPGAVLDVWQADGNGFYDVQRPDVQPRATGGVVHRGRRGPVLVPHLRPEPVPHPDGRSGRRTPQGHRPPPLPPRPHPLHRLGRGPHPGHHAHLRGGQRLPGLRRRLRRQTEPRRGLHPDRRPVPGTGVRHREPFRHARFDLVLDRA